MNVDDELERLILPTKRDPFEVGVHLRGTTGAPGRVTIANALSAGAADLRPLPDADRQVADLYLRSPSQSVGPSSDGVGGR